jgi:hypothetical protein
LFREQPIDLPLEVGEQPPNPLDMFRIATVPYLGDRLGEEGVMRRTGEGATSRVPSDGRYGGSLRLLHQPERVTATIRICSSNIK